MDISVIDLDQIPIGRQQRLHFISDHDGTVLPASAADRDRQVTLAFNDVIGNQK